MKSGILATFAAWVGEKDLACEQLATAVRCPTSGMELSYGQLKLMPWWDPLRGDSALRKNRRLISAERETLISRIVTNHRTFALTRVG